MQLFQKNIALEKEGGAVESKRRERVLHATVVWQHLCGMQHSEGGETTME